MQKTVKTVEELVAEYQGGNTGRFEDIMAQMRNPLHFFARQYSGTQGDYDDLHSIMTEVLWRCCDEFDCNRETKFTTMFFEYGKRKLREVRQRVAYDNRRANNFVNSFEQMHEDEGFDIEHKDHGFDDVDYLDMLATLNLTEKQREYIRLELGDKFMTKREMAHRIGVHESAIQYFQKAIGKKIQDFNDGQLKFVPSPLI